MSYKFDITDQQYETYTRFAKSITNDEDQAMDLLQDTLYKIIRLKVDKEKLTNNYIYSSLLYAWRDVNKKNKLVDTFEESWIESEDELDIANTKSEDREFQDKLNSIVYVVERLNDFDKKLYQLHIMWGFSCRKIAINVGVSHVMISKKINTIKEIINEYHKNKNNI